MRHELTVGLELSQEQAAMLDKHSLLNLCNVLEMQISLLSQRIKSRSLREYSHSCLELLMQMPRSGTAELVPEIERHCQKIDHHLRELMEEHPDEGGLIKGLLKTVSIGKARIEEFKQGSRFEWKEISMQDVEARLIQFLHATEEVSGGRFRFSYPPGKRDPSAYWLDFHIRAPEKEIWAPTVLHDSIRDLTGNARKYSEPGSSIHIDLESSDNKELRLCVADEGIGIPEEEIEKVVQFGYRGTNALDKRTMGGGFGLTKAYNLCRRFNGRFFIESESGKGTTIEMTLLPPD